MADHSNTDTQPFDSQSPSSLSPCGSKLKDANEDEYNYKHVQDTVPFDDTMVLDSPLTTTQLEKLDFDTQVVDDLEEVVPDSEDEGIHKTKVVSAANRLSFDRTYRRVKRNALDLQNRQFSPPCEQTKDLVADSDSSAAEKCGAGIKGCSVNNTEGIDGGKALNQLHAFEHEFARLNYVGSQEPGESSQANALDFVDHFVSSSNVDLSPGIDPRKTFRQKSPPVSSAKGPQSLAKRIKLRSPIAKTGTFEWVDSDQQGGGNFCNKRMDASFDFEGFRQRSVTRHQKARHLDSKGGSSTANECKEKKDFVNLQGNITDLAHSDSTFVENSPKEICKMEQVSGIKLDNNSLREFNEHLHADSSGQQLEASSFERDALDMFDVGINTQIAAEAMEALLNGPPPGCSAGGAYPDPQNTLKDSPRDVTKTKSHMEPAFLQKSAFSDSGGIARKTKRKRSARKFRIRTSSSFQKHSKNQELDPLLAITTKAKVGKLLSDGQLNCRNLAYANERSGRSINPIDQRKAEGAVGMNNIQECKNYMSSSTLVKHILLGNGQSEGEPVAHRTRQWMTRGTLKGTKDQSDKKMNDEGGILTYKRKRRHLVANPYAVSSAKEKCSKLCFNALEEVRNSKREQQEQTSLHVAAITSGLKLDAWSYPKGKRSRVKMQSHSNVVSNLSAPLATVNEKESITNSTKSQKRLEGKNVELCGSECTTAVNCTEGINVASSKKMPDEYHRKPCNKNLPKSYLLRELIRLGVPESIPNFAWKDLRRRRDMSNVRVLFSQHLDDDIIKQQKKILAQLGIFTASCSMDATHFIADRFVRTRNMLEAIALGKPVVTTLWLESCGQASCLIDVKNYILRDAKKEKEIGFSMPVSLAHASQHPLLKGKRVFITPNIKPDTEMISSLIKTVHGQAVERNQIPVRKDQKIPDDLLILSCEEDQAICVPFLDKGAAVYSSELLLKGIVIQKLEYERHQLFINHVKRNRPNRRSRTDAALSLSLPVNKCN